jgi:CheY-like chemotaxis protein
LEAAAGTAKIIMVVEDDAAAREAVAAILRRRGFTVSLAGDGRQALDLLEGRPPPDLILLDMLLPVLDGWHVLARLESRPAGMPAPVVITTGTILSREWAAAHGCAGFLKKPFGEAELLAELGRVLGRRDGELASPINAERVTEGRQ